jgi:hypothetical protein
MGSRTAEKQLALRITDTFQSSFDIFKRQKSAVRSRTLDFGGHGRFGLLLRRAAYDKVWVADIGISLILHHGQFLYHYDCKEDRLVVPLLDTTMFGRWSRTAGS